MDNSVGFRCARSIGSSVPLALLETIITETPTATATAIATATASLTPDANCPFEALVISSSNIRRGPSQNYNIVGSKAENELVTILGRSGTGEDVWYVIRHNNGEAWIWAGNVSTCKTLNDIPERSDIPEPDITNTPSSDQLAFVEGNWEVTTTVVESSAACWREARLLGYTFSTIESYYLREANNTTYVSYYSLRLYFVGQNTYRGREEDDGTGQEVTVTFSSRTTFFGERITWDTEGCNTRHTIQGLK
jgi:hypothetical protein